MGAQASIGRQGSQHLPKLPFHGNLCGHFLDVFIFPVRRTDSFRSITTPRLAPVPTAAHLLTQIRFGRTRIRDAGWLFLLLPYSLRVAPRRTPGEFKAHVARLVVRIYVTCRIHARSYTS